MKQIRCKVKSPWGEKGAIVKEMTFSFLHKGEDYGIVTAANYPDLFEEVEVKSDDEKLLFTKLIGLCRNAASVNLNSMEFVSHTLISENAFNTKWLKKLRDES